MKIQFFTLLLAVALCACGGDTATSSANQTEETTFSAAEMAAQTEAYEDMMELHDKIMPQMGSIAKMQKMLKDGMAADEGKKSQKMEEVYGQLENAYDGMMEWMETYMLPMDELRQMESQEAIMNHMGEGAEKMAEIENMLNGGMSSSYELLGIDPPAMNTDHDHSGHNHDHSDHNHDHSGHDH